MLNLKMITKRTWKKLGALTLAGAIAMTGVCGGTVVQAADIQSADWGAHKSPESNGTPSTTCTLTRYGGTIKFYTYTLGGAGYVAAKCKGDNCTINNSNKYVIRSVASKTSYTSFTIGNCTSQTKMKFVITVEHNGNIGSTIYGTGNIRY